MLKTVVLLNIFFLYFSRILDEQNVQKNSIYLKEIFDDSVKLPYV